jgi:hypothetical protein
MALETIQVVGIVITAVVGIAGLVLTLTGHVGRWWKRPRLSLSHDADDYGRVKTDMHWNREHPRIWTDRVRLAIRNDGRGTSAEGVRARLAGVVVHADAGAAGTRVRELSSGIPLAWADTDVHDREAESEPLSVSVGWPAIIDLAHVNELFPDQIWLDLRPRPHGDQHHLRGVKAVLTLVVEVSNARPQQWEAVVSLDRPWDDPAQDSAIRLVSLKRL